MPRHTTIVDNTLLLERKLLLSTCQKIEVQLTLLLRAYVETADLANKVVLVLVRIPRCPALYGWELRQGS